MSGVEGVDEVIGVSTSFREVLSQKMYCGFHESTLFAVGYGAAQPFGQYPSWGREVVHLRRVKAGEAEGSTCLNKRSVSRSDCGL